MPRPGNAAQTVAKTPDFNESKESRRIHFSRGRRENEIDAYLPAQREIRAQSTRIFFEIFSGAELDRIDEDTDYRYVIMLTAGANKACVAIMQRAHCGDQTDPPASLFLTTADCLHLSDGAYNSHKTIAV
jgi:hypothetical protein